MYSLVVFTLVLIAVLGGLIDATVDNEVANASGGFAVRADFNPANPVPDPARWLTITVLAGVAAIASVLATFWPARQASRIRAAVALRIAD